MPTYNADHKQWDHFGNLVPQVEYSESVRPHGEFLPASWLPVGGHQDKYIEEYFSIMPGKIIAMARDGKIVPAGYLRKFKAAAAGDVVLQYTQTDLDNKVVSLKSGALVDATDITANGSTGWFKSDLETALRARGLLGATEDLSQFVSAPMGVAPYGYYNAMSATDPNNPVDLRQHNFNVQHRVAILCDYVLELPWVPEVVASQTASVVGLVTDYTASQANTFFVQFTDTSKLPIAPDTMRTKWAFANDASSLFANRKLRIRDLKATGDYLVDDDLDRVYFYHGGNLAAAGAAADPVLITFYHYQSADDDNITSNFACVVGPIREGDYLKPTKKSNYQPVTKANAHFQLGAAVAAAYDQAALQALFDEVELNMEEQAQIIGQVLQIEKHPKGALEMVRSFGRNLPGNLYLDKMPGDATEGMPDKITYAGGANKVVRINIIRK